MKRMLATAAAFGVMLLTACGGGGTSGVSPQGGAQAAQAAAPALALPAGADPSAAAAAAYCTSTGGEVQKRQAVYGQNSASLLYLAQVKPFCQYTSKGKYPSRIYILLNTLYTTKPTLAALAYILAPAMGSQCGGNPASCYCSQLGGSDQFGGTTGAGGGWWYPSSSDNQMLEACMFPDMSSIDSWGLAYHSEGIIRGINLTKVMRYKYPGS